MFPHMTASSTVVFTHQLMLLFCNKTWIVYKSMKPTKNISAVEMVQRRALVAVTTSGSANHFSQVHTWHGQSPPPQESCDPSRGLVCSDLHFCLTSFLIYFLHRPSRKCIVIHSLDNTNCAFDRRNAIKMTFLACCQLKFLTLFMSGCIFWKIICLNLTNI